MNDSKLEGCCCCCCHCHSLLPRLSLCYCNDCDPNNPTDCMSSCPAPPFDQCQSNWPPPKSRRSDNIETVAQSNLHITHRLPSPPPPPLLYGDLLSTKQQRDTITIVGNSRLRGRRKYSFFGFLPQLELMHFCLIIIVISRHYWLPITSSCKGRVSGNYPGKGFPSFFFCTFIAMHETCSIQWNGTGCQFSAPCQSH